MRCRYARERRNRLLRNRLLSFRRLRLIGPKFARAVAKRMLNHVSADPAVEVVGCPNRGVETVLYRRRGRVSSMRLGPLRSPHRPMGSLTVVMETLPFGLCF